MACMYNVHTSVRGVKPPSFEITLPNIYPTLYLSQLGKGKVSFDEFVSFMISRQRQQNVTDDEMLEAFRVFDSDGDGYINGEDIRKTMRQLGEELSEKDVKDMMFEADLDKDGRINFAGKPTRLSFEKYF